jgi:hypothetical protein
MERNYPHFRKFVYQRLREEFLKNHEEWPNKDLETLAREWDAKSLEEFIGEFERADEGTNG